MKDNGMLRLNYACLKQALMKQVYMEQAITEKETHWTTEK